MMKAKTRHYVGGIEYFNGEMEAIYHEAGRVVFENSLPVYEYVLTDHLGNTRVVFKNVGGVASVVQESEYYPFGMAFEEQESEYGYTYSHKEAQTELGLKWLDFGARCLMVDNARWMQVDPLAERFNTSSSFSFTLNNPILFIDPTGMATTYNWNNQRYEDEDGNEVAWEDVKTEYGITGNSKGNNVFTTYLVNDTKADEEWKRPVKKALTANEMVKISGTASSIFEENGIDADVFVFRFISPEEGRALGNVAEENVLFLAFVNKENSLLYKSTNQSYVEASNRIRILNNDAWASYVNIKGGGFEGNRKQFIEQIGYITAHELLHQLLGYKNIGHTEGDINLNTTGRDIDFDKYHNDSHYRALARRLIIQHKYHLEKLINGL
ncbi:MAG: hypothetical protein HC892_19710 [Saprospiraceae bacterium]|nr:hypothetical protein [Saprospiraceae bacterium]